MIMSSHWSPPPTQSPPQHGVRRGKSPLSRHLCFLSTLYAGKMPIDFWPGELGAKREQEGIEVSNVRMGKSHRRI